VYSVLRGGIYEPASAYVAENCTLDNGRSCSSAVVLSNGASRRFDGVSSPLNQTGIFFRDIPRRLLWLSERVLKSRLLARTTSIFVLDSTRWNPSYYILHRFAYDVDSSISIASICFRLCNRVSRSSQRFECANASCVLAWRNCNGRNGTANLFSVVMAKVKSECDLVTSRLFFASYRDVRASLTLRGSYVID